MKDPKKLTSGRRWLLGLLVIFIGLLIGSSGYHHYLLWQEASWYPPPGKLYPVNGHDMHLDCRGTGSPTLVLEAGLMMGSSSWFRVHDELARVTQVCAYDRPGLDWSEPQANQLPADKVAENLHTLLQTAGLHGPLVLAGMSAGGVYARRYRDRYPDSVVGLVLIESSHEQQGRRLPGQDEGNPMRPMFQACSWLAPLGIVRWSGIMQGTVQRLNVPPAKQPPILALLHRNAVCTTALHEMDGFTGDVMQAQPPKQLGQLPLLVLSRSGVSESGESDSAQGATPDATEIVWRELQDELAALSAASRHVIVADAGHNIHLEQPELLVREMTRFITRVRESPPGTGID